MLLHQVSLQKNIKIGQRFMELFKWSYSKIKWHVFMDHVTMRVILFLNSLLASSKNKEYLTAVFKH